MTDELRNLKIKKILKFLESVKFKRIKDGEMVDSFREQFLVNGSLSDRQYEVLLNIYERV